MKIIVNGCSPINKAKMEANIMQMHELEGFPEEAKRWGYMAHETIVEANLRRSEEGNFVFSYVQGTLDRLAAGIPLKNPGKETY